MKSVVVSLVLTFAPARPGCTRNLSGGRAMSVREIAPAEYRALKVASRSLVRDLGGAEAAALVCRYQKSGIAGCRRGFLAARVRSGAEGASCRSEVARLPCSRGRWAIGPL
jgi:hypothetical protein